MNALVRSERIEVRATPDEYELIKRAAAAEGGTLTEFVISQLSLAARRVLADRDRFELSPEAQRAWEEINAHPARELPGLRRLIERPSPFGR
ncbi:MAG: DUF1778 domain-containing protein [Egibacteraceae bacterium]